jgi:asparagine synthase (glutamine-hydrolysing)
VVNGAGGDNLFASLNSAAPALDAWGLNGIRSAAVAIGDLAVIHNATRWHVLRLALRKASRQRRNQWLRVDRFMVPGTALAATDSHPWLPPPARELAGKREHVLSLIGIQHFLAQPRSDAAGLFPLLSQPLLELCLSIPTHLWIAGGRDRAVARAAFRGLVPDLVLDRRGKGRLESMFMKGYMQGRPQLEALLLEGELRAQGIIDGEAVSAYLRQSGEPRDAGFIRLLEIAAAETWLRSLSG